MKSYSVTATSSYQNLATLLGESLATSEVGFCRNRDTDLNVYIASGYFSAPSDSVGQVGPQAIVQFTSLTALDTWVKAQSGTAVIDIFVGSQGYTPHVSS